MNDKAHAHPYGSTVIPVVDGGPTHGGPSSVNTPRLPGSPSPIPGSLGIAGAVTVHLGNQQAAQEAPSTIAQTVDSLLDAFADRVADRVIALLAAKAKTSRVELEALFDGDDGDNWVDDYDGDEDFDEDSLDDVKTSDDIAEQMHVDLELALRERAFVAITRFAPQPLGFTIAGAECVAYAQPYQRGYTDGAKPDEYVLIANGRRVVRSSGKYIPGLDGARGYSTGLTLSELLETVDGALRAGSFGAS